VKSFLIATLLAFAPAKHPQPAITDQISILVVPQHASPEWERHITVHNPFRRSIWFWIECESKLTSKAVGIRGHRTSEYVFPGIPPGEQCKIHHWQFKIPGHKPKEWKL
jgi:hypothetical protein